MDIQRIAPTEDVKNLLVTSELPIDDLDDPAVELTAAIEGERVLGVIGLQWLDGAALLRSLVVASSARDRRIGAHLCDAAERQARERGLAELWLLTTSARDYFARRGYEVAPREKVPAVVRATAQFTSLCPSSATVMRRAL